MCAGEEGGEGGFGLFFLTEGASPAPVSVSAWWQLPTTFAGSVGGKLMGASTRTLGFASCFKKIWAHRRPRGGEGGGVNHHRYGKCETVAYWPPTERF